MLVLRLYTFGVRRKEVELVEGIRSVLDEKYRGRYRFEIIDLKKTPGEAEKEGIFATPTLVQEGSGSIRRVVAVRGSGQDLRAALGMR